MGKNLKEQDNELFFVEVKEPNEIRRNILEVLKEIIELLQRFEKYKHTRHEKLSKIQNLRGLVKDANKILGNLKVKLPQTNVRAYIPEEAKKTKKSSAMKKEVKEEKAPKKEKSELQRLEAELGAIESKLKSFT